MTAELTPHYVHFNGAAWFVKEGNFFEQQGGLSQEWGKSWLRIMASGIEDARRRAKVMFGEKGEHWNVQFSLMVSDANPPRIVYGAGDTALVRLMTDPQFIDDIATCNWRDQSHNMDEQEYAALLVAEELLELGQAIIKYYTRRKPVAKEKVIEETVDVLLMLDQMVRLLPEDELHKWMKFKLDRTIQRYHTPNSAYDDTAQF